MAKFKYIAYKGDRLDAEETEKVLTAHGLGMLMTGGRNWYPTLLDDPMFCKGAKGCINQIVHNIPITGEAWDTNPAVACWFDQNYNPKWTADELLESMRFWNVTEA